ncbi:hypothetical protein [Telmatospirillum sp.]|uniref:hypothetical protein n=1 Tax=Telmatospirillum sp. TaxID=2079197 RepID=UPI0028409E8F|nr:hypothetical protein [Telmatospirillum sp.]MDR3436397.1 hypothetical protein [Telmatospirillum sp.]
MSEAGMLVEVKVTAIRPMSVGKLVALADVLVTLGDLEMTIRSVRVESLGDVGTKVRMPVDRDGRALVVLPEEVASAVGDVVLAGGIEAGILRERCD